MIKFLVFYLKKFLCGKLYKLANFETKIKSKPFSIKLILIFKKVVQQRKFIKSIISSKGTEMIHSLDVTGRLSDFTLKYVVYLKFNFLFVFSSDLPSTHSIPASYGQQSRSSNVHRKFPVTTSTSVRWSMWTPPRVPAICTKWEESFESGRKDGSSSTDPNTASVTSSTRRHRGRSRVAPSTSSRSRMCSWIICRPSKVRIPG